MSKSLFSKIDRLRDEETLSQLIGDIPAYYAQAILKRCLQQGKRMRQTCLADLRDYFVEEALLVVGRAQFMARLQAISQLSQETETLSVRFHALKAMLQESAA